MQDYDKYLAELFTDLKHYTSGEDFGRPSLNVTFTIDAKEWKRMRDKGQLGSLYGVDLGNYLSRQGILKQYCVPTVGDRDNARGGRKTIRVTYNFNGRF